MYCQPSGKALPEYPNSRLFMVFVQKKHGFNKARGKKGEILFIDARELGHLINRRTREFSDGDIKKITETYHRWRKGDKQYRDEPGFCASIPIEKVAELDFVLSPGRYVGVADQENDIDFAERFKALRAEFEAQLKEETKINKRILKNLDSIDLEDEL